MWWRICGRPRPRRLILPITSLSALEKAPGNHGITVSIGADRFTQMTFEILQNYIPRMKMRVFMAETLEEAEEIVYSHRAQQHTSATRP